MINIYLSNISRYFLFISQMLMALPTSSVLFIIYTPNDIQVPAITCRVPEVRLEHQERLIMARSWVCSFVDSR